MLTIPRSSPTDVKQDTGLWIEPEPPPTAADTDSLIDDIDGDDSATPAADLPPSDKFGVRADRCADRACLHDLQERMRSYWQQKQDQQRLSRRRWWLAVLRQLHATVAVVQDDRAAAAAATDDDNSAENDTLPVNDRGTGMEQCAAWEGHRSCSRQTPHDRRTADTGFDSADEFAALDARMIGMAGNDTQPAHSNTAAGKTPSMLLHGFSKMRSSLRVAIIGARLRT